MDSRPALIAVLCSIVIITIVGFLCVDLTQRLQKEQEKEAQEDRSTVLEEKGAPEETEGTVEKQKKVPDGGANKGVERKEIRILKGENTSEENWPEMQEMPSFSLEPVNGEPVLPMSDAAAEKQGFVTLPRGGYTFSVPHPVHKDEVKGVAVPGMVIMRQGLIEFFGSIEGSGKDHETIVRLECEVTELDLGLKFAEMEPGDVPEKLGDPDVRQGSRVMVFVRWRDEGRTCTYHAEDLVIDVKREKTMPRVGWTYVGDWAEVDNPADPDKKKSKVLAATLSRLMLSTWRTTSALLDNPLPDAMDPDTYFANHDVLPRPGTPVLIYFRTPTKAERERIIKLEKEYAG